MVTNKFSQNLNKLAEILEAEYSTESVQIRIKNTTKVGIFTFGTLLIA